MATNIRRPISRRMQSNRDENAENQRIVRPVKDGLAGPSTTTIPVAKTTTAIGLANRKRNALGDVSNYVLNRDEQSIKFGKPSEKDLKGKGPAKPLLGKRISIEKIKSTSEASTDVVAVRASRSNLSEEILKTEDETTSNKKPHSRTVTQRASRESTVSSGKEEVAQRFSDKEGEPTTKRSKTEASAPDQGWQDLDAGDGDDPLMVSEYVTEIFEYMQKLEIKTMPKPNYMDNQKELAWKMRGILVDWLIEVHAKFRLLPETLFLAVNIIDRFLSARVVSLVKLQLVGITAMFIASKYEEVMSPSIQNFLYMADGGYGDDEILKAERYILQTLNFDLSYPNPMNFLRRISKADDYDISTRTVAKYLTEISLVDHRFLSHPPSEICAAAIWMARKALHRGPWNANLVHYSSYDEADFKEVTALMTDYLAQNIRHESFYKKYASKKFLKASVFMREWVSKGLETGDLPRLTEI